MLNHNKAHETAGILRQKINYISVVNTTIEKAKSKEESVHILENKALRKKKKKYLGQSSSQCTLCIGLTRNTSFQR